MSRTKSFPGQLLVQAHHLATKESNRPQQVSLRRAISTAYYALFHFLIDESCRIWIGSGPPNDVIRATLARAFEHGQMAKASEAFDLPVLAGQPFKGKFAKSGIAVPQELRVIARTFLRLQERRHQADYFYSGRSLAGPSVSLAKPGIAVTAQAASRHSGRDLPWRKPGVSRGKRQAPRCSSAVELRPLA